MKEIEDMIEDRFLPVNSIAMLDRLKELLKESETNNLEECREDKRIRRLMWLMNQQMYGQLGVIDLSREWRALTEGGR